MKKLTRDSSTMVILQGQCSVQGLEKCDNFVLQFGPLNSQSLTFCDVTVIYRTCSNLKEKNSKLGAKQDILEGFTVQKIRVESLSFGLKFEN